MSVSAWQVYFVIGLVLISGEIFLPGFILAPLGIASLLTALAALVTDSVPGQLIFLGSTAIVVYVSLSGFAKSRLNRTRDPIPLGPQGQSGTILIPCQSQEHTGKVKVYGDIWDIYWDPKDPEGMAQLRQLSEGSSVIVVGVYGNRLKIAPKPSISLEVK